MIDLEDLAKRINVLSNKNGFYEPEIAHPAIKIALMHSELSELLEAFREINVPSEKIPSYTWAEEELADLIIRALDFAQQFNLRISAPILAKHAYNESRPYKHGKRF